MRTISVRAPTGRRVLIEVITIFSRRKSTRLTRAGSTIGGKPVTEGRNRSAGSVHPSGFGVMPDILPDAVYELSFFSSHQDAKARESPRFVFVSV